MQVPSHADALLRKIAGPSGLLADRYRPLEVLGQGGMGVVFHALDERLQREVAIKAIRADLMTPEFMSRFAAEAVALARIHHPNVVQIIDVSEPGSRTAYYVMELVRGTPLSRLMRERGRLPWSQACDLLTQIASALAAVHAAGVVHRDLKPSNVLCVKTGRDSWHAELIDFGIAIAPGMPRLTRPGETLGTLPYMSPEQFTGAAIDRRTDVYGWGVLALELLGGVKPAELFGDTARAGAPLRERAPAVLERARVRPDLARIVERCLATRPDDRWPDMESVHGELADLDGERGPTLVYQRPEAIPRTGTVVPGHVFAAAPSPPAPEVARRRSSTPLVAAVVLVSIGGFAWLVHGREGTAAAARVEAAMQTWPSIAARSEAVAAAPVTVAPATEISIESVVAPPVESPPVVAPETSTPPIARARAAVPRKTPRPSSRSAEAPQATAAPEAPAPRSASPDEASPKPFVRDPFAK